MATATKTKGKALPAAGEDAPELAQEDLGLVELDQLHDSPFQPRLVYEEAPLRELADSIARVGVLQDLLVRPREAGGYETIFGHRRRRAAKLAGFMRVPCKLVRVDDEVARQLLWDENNKHAQLSALEQAAFLAGWAATSTISRVAERTGHTVVFVRTRVALHGLDDASKTALRDGQITIAVAQLLAGVPGAEDRAKVLEFATDAGRWSGPAPAFAVERWLDDHVARLLSKAPWGLDDDTLALGCPACTSCPDRTGAQVELFPGSTEDRCLKPSCWRTKLDAWAKDQADHHGGLARIVDTYGQRKGGDGPVPSWGWVEVKPATEEVLAKLRKDVEEDARADADMRSKHEQATTEEVESAIEEAVRQVVEDDFRPDCEHARMAQFAAGPRKGEVIRACLERTCKVHKAYFAHEPEAPSAPRDQKAYEAGLAAEREKRTAEVRARNEVLSHVLARIRLEDGEHLGPDEAFLVAESLMPHRQEDQALTLARHSWEAGKPFPVSGLLTGDRSLLIVEWALLDDVTTYGDPERLLKAAKRLGVDARAVMKASLKGDPLPIGGPPARPAKAKAKPAPKKKAKPAAKAKKKR